MPPLYKTNFDQKMLGRDEDRKDTDACQNNARDNWHEKQLWPIIYIKYIFQTWRRLTI